MNHTKSALIVLTAAALLSAAAGQPATTPPPGQAVPATAQPAGQPPAARPLPTPPGLRTGAPQAQPGQPVAPPAPPPPPREPKTFKWSDGDLEKIGSSLAGTWKTTAPVAQGDAKDQKTDVVMTITPVAIDGIPNAMYVETARADSAWAPYRQGIFQLYKHKGQPRLRTLNFHSTIDGKPNNDFVGALVGQWAVPQYFTDIKLDNLVGTLDLDVKASGSGFSAKTPYPYPTATGGAVEMTSEFTFDGKTLSTADRGYDADGKVVWGSSEGDKYTFAKSSPVAKVTTKEGGLIVIAFNEGTEGKAIEKDDQVAAHYTGWLVATGKQFDSSRRPNRPPMNFKQGGLIEGWNEGLLGFKTGSHVRLVIPPKQGYGENGKGPIPGNSWLVFDVEIMNVQAPAPPPPPAAPAGDAAPAGPPSGSPAPASTITPAPKPADAPQK